MNLSAANLKASLRAQGLARLKGLPAEGRVAGSVQLCERFTRAELAAAQSILFFAPVSVEPDIWPLLQHALDDGRTVALPRFDTTAREYCAARVQNLVTDVTTGAFGIREPGTHCPELPLNRLDLVLVPGVAFDAEGWRLGRGKGFYDRLLTQVRGTTCGVAFDEQIVETIPVEPHDVRLNCILTPTRLIET